MGEKIITRKGIVSFSEKDLVKKEYFSLKRMEKEYTALMKVYNTFPNTRINEWNYKAVKPVLKEPKESYIVMEKAKGEPISEYIKRGNDRIHYHVGVWLAIFHNQTLDRNKVLVFSDFSRMNVIASDNLKEISTVDPGATFGEMLEPEIDIFSYLYSITMGNLLCLNNPIPSIKGFILGYYSYAKTKCVFKRFKNVFKKTTKKRLESLSKKRPFKKLLSFFALGIFVLIYKIRIEKLIKHIEKEGVRLI